MSSLPARTSKDEEMDLEAIKAREFEIEVASSFYEHGSVKKIARDFKLTESAAQEAVNRGLELRYAQRMRSPDAMRERAAMIFDKALTALWDLGVKAEAGDFSDVDLNKVESVIKVVKAQAELLGLNRPQEGTGQGSGQMVQVVVNTAPPDEEAEFIDESSQGDGEDPGPAPPEPGRA